MLKRAFDVALSAIGLVVTSPLLLVIAAAVRATSHGPAVHWSKRVGRGGALFLMPKFRTMRVDTPQVATHLMSDPARWATPIGPTLRRFSLDELPQLWSVLKGDMSLVGPRPALFNQADLIALRASAGVDELRPGITGWAQVNGRDDLPIPAKVALDEDYRARISFWFDLTIILRTVTSLFAGQGVSH